MLAAALLVACGSAPPAETVTETVEVPTTTTTIGPTPTQRAKETLKDYYEHISDRDFPAAWEILTPSLQRAAGGYERWSRRYANTIFARTRAITALAGGDRRAVFFLRLVTTDVDGCGNSVVGTSLARWSMMMTPDGWRASDNTLVPLDPPRTQANADECAPPVSDDDDGYAPGYGRGGRPLYDPGGGTAPGQNIPNYENGRGYRVQCNDGTYSRSGGIQGACSHHGGV
jgi:hypothetical protein